EGSLDGGEREVDVEPPARGMDASEAFGRLERPHFLEANEDKRPLPAGDDARGRTRGVRLQPGLHVHVTAPDGLRMRDPRPALTVLRCAQEIVTNAVLHARAQNLWLELSQHDGVLSLSARDDGRGASELRAGNGYSNSEEVLLAIHPCSPLANGQRGPIGSRRARRFGARQRSIVRPVQSLDSKPSRIDQQSRAAGARRRSFSATSLYVSSQSLPVPQARVGRGERRPLLDSRRYRLRRSPAARRP